MSKNSHAKHEHDDHHSEHGHHATGVSEPTYGQKHKKLIWLIVLFMVVLGPLIMAVYSVSRALFH